MGRKALNLNEPTCEGGYLRYVMLQKDGKQISRARCLNPELRVPSVWNIAEIRPVAKFSLTGLPRCFLGPAFQNSHQKKEWGDFLSFLKKHDRVAAVNSEECDFYIFPPDVDVETSHVTVAYQEKKTFCLNSQDNKLENASTTQLYDCQKMRPVQSAPNGGTCGSIPPNAHAAGNSYQDMPRSVREDIAESSAVNARVPDSNISDSRFSARCHSSDVNIPREASQSDFANPEKVYLQKNFVKTDPSYLKTLSQTHSGWIFGAIAELVDNSRDAKASRLHISIGALYSKKAQKKIPVLSVQDDGCGMSHQEIVRMLSFGRKQPDKDIPDHIGRFGIGFKTGAMRLGQDAIVLTQNSNSRSVALLSQSFNESKDNLEIPIVSYHREGSFMEVDISLQSQASADYHLKAIKEFSPFNEYFIGEKLALFGDSGTGTQIYVWNLDKWGSDYTLEWVDANSLDQSRGDILIRSRRVRSRPGQTSQKVPLDYSLRSYLEVIFLDPRMKIYVQDSQIKSCPLAKSLSKTFVVTGEIMGRHVELTLGYSQVEWERVNSGMFLYWHGRLIEAYKRVGGMVHNSDMGRGVIGVIDVTDVMDDRNGRAMVLNNKQGFQDTELYAKLEEWLGNKADEYWDNNFDNLYVRKGNAKYKPDHEWVQCDKCRKWRVLTAGFDTETLPQEWFCYMPPFNSRCEVPEQKIKQGVITVGAKRSGPAQNLVQPEQAEETNKHDLPDRESAERPSHAADGVPPPPLKRLRRGPARKGKKKA